MYHYFFLNNIGSCTAAKAPIRVRGGGVRGGGEEWGQGSGKKGQRVEGGQREEGGGVEGKHAGPGIIWIKF